MIQDKATIMNCEDMSNFNEVELYLKAHGRLPSNESDAVTQETLDLFMEKFDEMKKEHCHFSIWKHIRDGDFKPLKPTSDEMTKFMISVGHKFIDNEWRVS